MTPDTVKAKTQEELNREAYLDGIGDEQFMEYVKNTRPELYARWMAGPRRNRDGFEILSTHSRDAEEIVTIYGALSTYLTILAQQPEKDLETIARVTRLLIVTKSAAVAASQEIANRNTAS